MKRKRRIIRVFTILLGTIFVLLAILLFMFRKELRTLNSIEKIDDYGMYQMTYYGDYGFDDFLRTGAKNDADIEAFVTKRLLKGLPIDLNVTGAGCTAFVTNNDNGDVIFGRNFDYEYAPSMVLYTKPDQGYASISTVNLAFAGYSEDHLPSGLNFDSFLALAAPYLPFDGMNEKGVAMALLAVPEAKPAYHPDKITLNTTTSIRLVLDKAATVDEAVELLKQYNIYFSGDVDCHYLIADATGRSVIIEYYDNDIRVVEADEDYQIASNFIAFNDLNIGDGYNEFERYEIVQDTIMNHGGKLNETDALNLLAQIGIVDEGIDRLQWSLVYNLSSLEEDIFAHRNVNNIRKIKMKDFIE